MSAATFARCAGGARQNGSVVVELALILVFAIPMIFAPIAIARALLHANVTQRAVGNTVRMVATYPPFQRQGAGVDFEADAKEMLNGALRRSGVVAGDFEVGDLVEFVCDVPRSIKCRGTTTPEQLSIGVQISLLDPSSHFTDMQATFPPAEFFVYDRYAFGSGQP